MSTHPDDLSDTELKQLRVTATTEVKPFLEDVLAGTVELQKADFGCVHFCNPATKWPEMVAYRGLRRDFIGDFLQDGHDERTIWSRALVQGRRLIVGDTGLKIFGLMRVSPRTVPAPLAPIVRFNPHPCSAATAYRSAPSQHSFESLKIGQTRTFASAISTPQWP